MPNVYTRSGDKGTTGLFGGSRTLKNDLRVDAYGTMDEAESNIGFARSIIEDEEIKSILLRVQERMFLLQAELASDENGKKELIDPINQDDIDFLESTIDHYLNIVGKQFDFVRPGANPTSAYLHVARTVVRRGERRMIDLQQEVPDAVRPEMLKFVNRLSDLLFVLARVEEYNGLANKIRNIAEKLMNTDTSIQPDDPDNISILTLAKRMAAASRIKARELGVPIVFAAVDKDGNLSYLEREPESLLVSIDVAQRKAYTSAALRLPTGDLAELTKEGGPLVGLQIADGGLIVFAGGFPVIIDGDIVGAIGVSGGTAEEDAEIAKAGLAVLDK